MSSKKWPCTVYKDKKLIEQFLATPVTIIILDFRGTYVM